ELARGGAPEGRDARAGVPAAKPAQAKPAYSRPTYASQARVTDWAPLETDLPPDYPIEPNHRYSPTERIAAAQAGSPLGTGRASGNPDADAKASFIAAARRAAQTASSQLIERADRRVP